MESNLSTKLLILGWVKNIIRLNSLDETDVESLTESFSTELHRFISESDSREILTGLLYAMTMAASLLSSIDDDFTIQHIEDNYFYPIALEMMDKNASQK